MDTMSTSSVLASFLYDAVCLVLNCAYLDVWSGVNRLLLTLYVLASFFMYTITLSPINSTPPAGDHGFGCLLLAGGFLLRRLNMGGQHGAGKADK